MDSTETDPTRRVLRTGELERTKAGLTAVSSLDWKLGARLLLKYPALTSVIMAAVGALACAAPARRPPHIQPTETLREG